MTGPNKIHLDHATSNRMQLTQSILLIEQKH